MIRSCAAVALLLMLSATASAEAVSIRVAAEPSGKVSRDLIGLNHRYAFDGFGSFDPGTARVAPKLVAGIRDAGVSMLRYPGGTLANTFRWRGAIGPQSRRTCQVHAATGEPLTSSFGPDEAGAMAEQVGAELAVVVNFATATPAEAAAWVHYMNDPAGSSRWARLRARHGHRAPYGVRWWEVGNEMAQETQAYWMGSGLEIPLAINRDANAQRYAFGGTNRFTNQAMVRPCDWRADAGKGDGSPGQSRVARFPPVAAGQVVTVGGTPWREVESLGDAGADERVYTIQRSTGRVRFGDGTHGAIPADGATIAITYDSGPHGGFVDFYRAMKAADPSIRVCAGDSDPVAPAQETFTEAMGSAHPYDCLQVHPYRLIAAPMDPATIHDYAMEGADEAARQVAAIQQQAQARSGRRIPAMVSEFGLLGVGYSGPTPHYLASLDQALYTASLIVELAALDVPVALKHTLTDFDPAKAPPGATSLGGPDQAVFGFSPSFVPSATAHALAVISQATGGPRLAASIEDNPARSSVGGSYTALRALASRGRRGERRIVVVNRDPQAAITAFVDPGAAHGGRVVARTVTGPSTTSFNSVESPGTVGTARVARRVASGTFEWEFPARSVTVLSLRGARAR